MNLKEFAHIDSLYRDLDTGHEIPWKDYMRRVIGKLGLENIKPYLPFGLDYLKEKLKDDVNLNNTNIRSWDFASGFIPHINRKTKVLEYERAHGGIGYLFVRNGITCYSVSDCVSVLKEAARMLVEREIQ